MDFLNLKDAVKLFKRNYGREYIDDNTIQEIVKDLDFHTLTIEILAKTAKKRDQLPASILEFLKQNMRADLNVRHNKGESNKKIERVTNYLCEIFNNIKCLSDDNKWLLQQISCLPAEYHNYKKILKELITREEFDLRENLEDLSEGGWLQYDSKKDDYKLHRIVIEVVHRSIPVKVEDILPLLSAINLRLSVKWDKENPISKFKWIQFGKTILNLFKTDEDSKIQVINSLQNNLALVLKDLGGIHNLQEAKGWLEKAKDSAEENFGKKHPTTAALYSNLALVLQGLKGKDNLQEAKDWLEKAKDFDEENFGKTHPTTAIRYSNLALVLKDLGGIHNLQEAKGWLEKAKDSDEENFGKTHPATAIHYSNLALVLIDLGGKDNLQEAKDLLEKAKDSAEENFGKTHPTTATRYSNLGTVLQALGGNDNLQEAKDWLEKAKDSDEENFGKTHPATTVRYSNLALVLKALGGIHNLQEAKGWLEKAKDSDEENFGKTHPTTAIRYSNLALVLQALGGKDNLQEAKDLLEKALTILEISLGKEHSTTKIIQENLECLKSLLKCKISFLNIKNQFFVFLKNLLGV